MRRARVVFIPDLHFPYQDKDAVKTSLKLITAHGPHIIVLLGDVLDFEGLARFDNKDPKKSYNLQEELDEARDYLSTVRDTAPNARIVYLEGNHEYRLIKYTRNNAPAFHNLRALEMESLLSLEDIDITYVPQGRVLINDRLIKHGKMVRQKSGYTAMGEMEKSFMSGVSGHTHRASHTYVTTQGSEMEWIESGCLCRNDMDYLEWDVPNWQLALTYGETDYDTKESYYTVQKLNKKKEVCYNGKLL